MVLGSIFIKKSEYKEYFVNIFIFLKKIKTETETGVGAHLLTTEGESEHDVFYFRLSLLKRPQTQTRNV